MDAVKRQIGEGTHFGYAHAHEVELAETIVDMVPSAEMVRFTNSGTEANMYAVRLARTYTNRTKIAKFEGGWHGGYDALHKAVHPPFTIPESAGLDPKALEDTLVLPFNDLDGVRSAVGSERLACMIVEPVMTASGFIAPEPEFLKGLRELCDEEGALLVFDEVVTGFRFGLGGAQELYGVEPDITILGKVMGGGFPVGAFCGREDIFEHIDHRKYPRMDERSAHGGTFTGNPVSMVAGTETLRELEDGKVHDHIDRLGEKVRKGLQAVFQDSDIEAAVTGLKSTFGIHFQKERPRSARDLTKNDAHTTQAYYNYMRSKWITFMSPSIPHMFVSDAHTDEDIDGFLRATEDFAKNYK